MRRPVKYLVSVTAVVLFLTVFFCFGLPAILKGVLKSQIKKNLHCPSSVESISFNPFNLCLTVQGLFILEQKSDAVLVSFDLLRLNAEIVSVFEGGIDLSEVTLVKPFVRLVRTELYTYNFQNIFVGTEKKSAVKPSKPMLFSVGNIRITGGVIEFDDRPKKSVHMVTDLELNLPLISNFKHQVDNFVQPMFSATINGRPFNLTGQSKPFTDTLETSAEINITDLSLAQYLAYVPAELNFKMISGLLSTRLVLNYIQRADKKMELRVQGNLGLKELEIVSFNDNPILKLPSMEVSGINCGFNERDIVIDDIVLEGMSLAVVREKDGSISLQKMVGTDNQTSGKPVAQLQAPADESLWTMQVKKLRFKEGAISFDDLFPVQPAKIHIDSINFIFNNLATSKNSSADLDYSCIINNNSPLSLLGNLTLNPLTVNLNLDLAKLDIRFARSYLPDTLQLDLTQGILRLKGSIDYKMVKDSAPDIIWQGGMNLVNFAAERSGDKKDLLKFSSLDLKSMRVRTSPLSLDIKTVKLTGFFMRPVIEADGRMNLSTLNSEPKAPATHSASASSKKEPLPSIDISVIDLENGRVLFVDKSIKPRYSTDLTDIQGRILNISTKPDSPANIQLSANLNKYAPFKLSGTIKPLQEKLDADIKILFKNIDLNSFSPYSGKFIGRIIKKGSLSLDLDYKIQDNQLVSQNKVFLDQFILGKSVKSKEATSLPVGLAISLLKDRNGEIHLDLPVSGSLDDPGFKVRKVILKMLVNLLEKAATSPFTLLGKLIPGGAEISTINFACGTSRLNDEAIKKLDLLAGLLIKKPDLNLEIQSVAETDLDREGLRKEKIMQKMRSLKFNDLSKKEREGLAIGKVIIESEEYEDYLRLAYKDEKFKKPKGFLGINKRLPANEMWSLMEKHTSVDDEDMNALQQQRGLVGKHYLIETHKVLAERLFIVDSRFASGKVPEDSCVEFKLK